MPPGGHYNEYYPGHVIAMPKPLSDGQVTYAKGANGQPVAPETVDQYSRDVSAFLMWIAEPQLVDRKETGFKVMASTESCAIAGMADDERRFYALQFHPEVTHTVQGARILSRFVLDICGCRADWVMGDHIAEAVEAMKRGVDRQTARRNVPAAVP